MPLGLLWLLVTVSLLAMVVSGPLALVLVWQARARLRRIEASLAGLEERIAGLAEAQRERPDQAGPGNRAAASFDPSRQTPAEAGPAVIPPLPEQTDPRPEPAPSVGASPAAGQARPPQSGRLPAKAGQGSSPAPARSAATPARVGAALPAAQPPSALALPLWADRWTGWLGVVVVVAGVSFLGVGLALWLGPFGRFLMVLAAALALALPALLGATRRRRWRRLALAMRSGGAALVLFACVASSGLPQLGLRWIASPLAALALLSLGVLVNLWLAALVRRPDLAALHVLLNLVPLATAAPSLGSLSFASGIIVVGLLLHRRHHWPLQRLSLGLGFGAFLIGWFARAASFALPGPAAPWGVTLGLAATPFLVGVVWPQLGPAGTRGRFDLRQLLQLLLHWGALALVLLLVPPVPLVRAVCLAAAAALAWALAVGPAGGGQPLWRRRTSILVAQSLVLCALQSLDPLVPSRLLLALAAFVECSLFLRLVMLEQDRALQRLAWILALLAGALVLVLGVAEGVAAAGRDPERLSVAQLQSSGLLLAAGWLSLRVQRQLGIWEALPPQPTLLGGLGAGHLVVGSQLCAPLAVSPLLTLMAIGGLLAESRRPTTRPEAHLERSAGWAVLVCHGLVWWRLGDGQIWPPTVVLWQLVPLLLLAGQAVRIGAGPWRGRSLVLLGLSVLVAVPLLLAPLHPLLPSLVWMALSMGCLERARCSRDPFGPQWLLLGALALAAVFTALPEVILTSPASAFGLPLRWPLQLLLLGALLRWWFYAPRGILAGLPLWRRLHPWLPELLVAVVLVLVLREVAAPLHALVWVLLALGLLTPWALRLFTRRIQVWSLLLYGLSIAAGLSAPASADPLALVLQLAYAAVAHWRLQLEVMPVPPGLAGLGTLASAIGRHRDRWICYPLFAALAVLLPQRFAAVPLTVLLVAEAVLIYGFSLLLREQQFRLLALALLGVCLVRLVGVDLATADLSLRGAVFLGVGLLMLAMNALHERFGGGVR